MHDGHADNTITTHSKFQGMAGFFLPPDIAGIPGFGILPEEGING
jgi:hypothetical protein